ncbi:hypothetical protein JCM11641_003983 [Rhodosporidiobolus odoratus]
MATITLQPKAPRSQFLQKLHSLLENPLDAAGLRWVTVDSFEISSKDAVAIRALSPQFEFNSLSSFIRQLSYYAFRRLSDRRRSTERRASNAGYITFSHPTGFFLRGDPSKLSQIVRKARARPEKPTGRRISMCSVASDDFGTAPPLPLPHHPLPQWEPPALHPQFSSERQPLPSLQGLPSFIPTLSTAPRFDSVSQWRNYAPQGHGWLDPNQAEHFEHVAPAYRRASLGDLSLSTTMATSCSSALATLPEGRPVLRKAVSSGELPTVESLHEVEAVYHHQHEHTTPEQAYLPTPTFESSASTYFSSHIPAHSAHDYPSPTHAHSHYSTSPQPDSHSVHSRSHLTYNPISSASSFAPTYAPIAPAPSPAVKLLPSVLSLPSPDHSPHYASPNHSPDLHSIPLPPSAMQHLDPRQLDYPAPPTLHYTHGPYQKQPHQRQHQYEEEDHHHRLPLLPPQHFLPTVTATAEESSPRSSYPHLPRLATAVVEQYHFSPHHRHHEVHAEVQHSPWSPAPIRSAY